MRRKSFRALLAAGLIVFGMAFAAYAAFQDDPTDPDRDGFGNGEETLMGTNPNAFDANLNDLQLLTLLQKRNFDFFWLESKPPYYLTPDRGHYDQVGSGGQVKSIASTGFALTAMVVADSNGWVDHVEAYNRTKIVLSRLREMQLSGDPNLSKHGFFYHFTDERGFRYAQGGFNSELSTIDHALLLAGVMLAGQYYKGTEVEALAKGLYEDTDWPFMHDGQFFYQAWEMNGGPVEGGSYTTNARWDRYSELMILLLQGIGSPSHPVGASMWNDFSRGAVTYKTFPAYVHVGALFAHQFSHVWVDFRRKRDGKGIDYFENSRIATEVNRQFCIDLNAADPGRYETYGEHSWGLSSADSSVGYIVLQPDFDLPNMVEFNTDSGTVVPDAALGSVPFTPHYSIRAAQNWFTNHRAETFGRYGFRNAFNFGRPNNPNALSHFPTSKLSLDNGVVVSMIENYRTGLVWKFFGRSTAMQDAMNRVGFLSDAIPWQMNFDNQPVPGQDPNGFGGFSGAFGPGGGSSYASIADVNAFVRGFVWVVSASGVQTTGGTKFAATTPSSGPAGAFNVLNGHDISRFDTLSFWIKGQAGGEQVRVGLKDTSGTEATVAVADYLPGRALTTDFTGVRIPLSAFTAQGARLTTMDNISFQFPAGQGGTVMIDDIAFLPDEFKPAVPSALQGVLSGTNVLLSWNTNVERDVVGYNVYRASDASGPFVKINNFVVVGNAYQDSGALANAGQVFHYRITAVDNALAPNESAMSSAVVLPNLGPTLDSVGNKAVVQNNLLAFTVSATDPNSDALTYGASNLPAGATFDPATRLFSWTPSASQTGLHKNVRFSVSDGPFTDFEDITIAVSDNAVGTLEAQLKDISSDQGNSSGIVFGSVGSGASFTPSGQYAEFSAFSSLNNWKVQIYTDNANNSYTKTVPGSGGGKFGSPDTVVVVPNPFTGSGSGGGLIGQKSSKFRVPLKWSVFSAKTAASSLPSSPASWGFIKDKSDADFASSLNDRVVLDSSGVLGNFPSAGRSAGNASVFLYFAAEFKGAPAQSYSTNQLILEVFQQ